MKRVLAISDLTLNNFLVSEVGHGFALEFRYCEDPSLELFSLLEDANSAVFDVVYLHIDNYFKQYDKDHLLSIYNLLNSLSAKVDAVFVSNLMFIDQVYHELTNMQTVLREQVRFLEVCGTNNNIFVLDHISGLLRIGVLGAYNYELGHLYQMPYKKPFIQYQKRCLSDMLAAIIFEPKKVIVVDCDNTLWRGIVGEDGVDNISCDSTSQGVVYQNFQRFLRSKKKQGMLLGICSKNNYEDVKEAFDRHRFPLRFDDFVVKKINWEDKASNIMAISEELNVGIDAIIYIDDSDFELSIVSALLPQVTCLKISEEFEVYDALINSIYFKKKYITKDDEERTLRYQSELYRKQQFNSARSVEDYIQSLHIECQFKKNNDVDLVRASQMTERTNQFNFNKKAFSVEELRNILKSNGIIYSCNASDIHGDYGTIGLAIIIRSVAEGQVLRAFLLSCRAIGRGIERRFFQYILEDLENNGLRLDSIDFVKSERNKPAQDFYYSIRQNDTRKITENL